MADVENDKRPVNLAITTISLPVTAYASILHRASGVLLFAGVGLLLWMFDVSLSSEQGFRRVADAFDSLPFRLALFVTLAALAYHCVAGIKHLLMDFGVGESLRGGKVMAIATLGDFLLPDPRDRLGHFAVIKPVTSFARSGLADWLAQRVSAVVLFAYGSVVGRFVTTTEDLNYAMWSAFFDATWMKIFTLMALLALCVHAWIGLWSVSTDYLTPRTFGKGATAARLAFQAACAAGLFVYLVWGSLILFSN